MLTVSWSRLLYPNPIEESGYQRPVDLPPSRFRRLHAIPLAISDASDSKNRRLSDDTHRGAIVSGTSDLSHRKLNGVSEASPNPFGSPLLQGSRELTSQCNGCTY